MDRSHIPMIPGRRNALPLVYGDTPSFLGCDVLDRPPEGPGFDVLVAGVPWEGTVTWGSYSGCELAPRSIRHAAARYGGYLPEYDINLLDHLRIGDIGDLALHPNDPEATMQAVLRAARGIYRAGAVPFTLGGDHSFTPEIVRALGEHGGDPVGVIHFDAHLDNTAAYGTDRFPRCGPLHRIAALPSVRPAAIVHFGIRGPRNSPAQMAAARDCGATVMTIRRVRELGVPEAVRQAMAIAGDGTRSVYVTICSDVFDAGFNPGGPADFNGLFPHELFEALYRLGEAGLSGLDYVEVYPLQDPGGRSSHLAAWAIIHALAGLAARKRDRTSPPSS